ncbi:MULTISPECIES: thiol-disulfide oxidoreductase DCC family protein [Streptomyces]|uniref:thiol-disulfide oxidoreductase DCC family protein n=1 Tax=Streptomyces TaxID=1883 RepID=UPI001943806B|nr:DUF393 domain-containing protein [Streptomyces coelicoflavus]
MPDRNAAGRHEGVRPVPTLLFDGDCGFCTTAVRWIERNVSPRCESVAWQRADLRGIGVTRQRAQREALWVTPAGTVYGGADAVSKLLLSAGGGWSLLGALLMVEPVRRVAHGVYRLVADNRSRLPGTTDACFRSEAGARHT